MNTETRGWIASAILAPICLVTLSWTLVIFHTNRRKWQSKDIIISTLITQGIIKQIATFLYALIILLKPIDYFETYCGCVKWLITSIDIFQGATIGTLIFTRLLAIRFPEKFRATIKRTHLYYHLITLGILSSCIGIASILAEKVEENLLDNDTVKYCTFLPYELNPKYAFLSISLNSVIDVSTIVALIWTICEFHAKKRWIAAKNYSTPSTIRKNTNQRHALMTSSSDLSHMSDMSLRSMQNAARIGRLEKTHETNLGQYAGYNNSKTNMNRMFDQSNHGFQSGDHFYGDCSIGKSSSDTLTSSKLLDNYHHGLNSPKSPSSNFDDVYSPTPVNRWASEASYLSTSTSSTNSRAPCISRQPREENLGLATTIAIFVLCFLLNHLPFLSVTILGTWAPSRVPEWPLNAYLLWAGLLQDCLLPVVLAAVDTHFKIWLRHVYTRQHRTPLAKHQGLDGKFRVFNTPLQSMQPIQLLHNEPMKFPLTNGSLFTSVDGRLPILHNYRRGQGQRTNGLLASHCISMGLPAAMRRVEFQARIQDQDRKMRMNDSNSYSQGTGSFPDINNSVAVRSFEDVERRQVHELFNENMRRNVHMQDFRISNLDLEPFRSNTLDRSDFEDLNDFDSEPIYATLSSRSCCSATTAANDDFEFFQNEQNGITDAVNCSIMTNKFEEYADSQVNANVNNSTLPIALANSVTSERCLTVDEPNNPILETDTMPSDNKILSSSSASDLEEELESHTTPADENHITNEEMVSAIDQCFKKIHDEHLDTPIIQTISILEDNVMDSLVLESFNNLKHFHELRYHDPDEEANRSQRNRPSVEHIPEDLSESSVDFSTGSSFHRNLSIEEGLSDLKSFQLRDFESMFNSEMKENSSRRLYKKTPLNRRYLEPQSTKRLNTPPTNRRLMKPKRLEKTPPINRKALVQPFHIHHPELSRDISLRRNRQRKMSPVLSVDSLSAALTNADVSYLDNGDLWKHGREIGGSVPDFKKIFVSDFI